MRKVSHAAAHRLDDGLDRILFLVVGQDLAVKLPLELFADFLQRFVLLAPAVVLMSTASGAAQMRL